MTLGELIALLIGIALTIYLVWMMLFPEKG